MSDRWTALHDFWSGFDLPAYDQATVPADATYPRLTYEASVSSFDEQVMLNASIWYYSIGWEEISQKADEIGNAIGDGGIIVHYTGGAVWIVRGTPFAQRMTDPEPNLRRILLTIECDFLT